MTMTRCCRDTLAQYQPRDPIEGLELGCRWCERYMRYERAGDVFAWVVHDPVGDFVAREATPAATESREKAYQRILGKERSR